MNKLGIISLLLISAAGCSEHASEEGTGRLQIRLDVDPSVTVSRTKSSDATAFTLEISRDGDIVRTISPIGEAPDPIELTAGDYLLTAYSEPFETPQFDTPVYGGSAPTRISVGKQSEASVSCAQTNAGVRISYTDDFAAAHPVRSASVRQIEGILNFEGDDAERTGYFLPGSATLVVTAGKAQYEQELTLEARKLYLIEIDDTPEPTSGRLSVSITVSTDVTEEQVQILFPSGRIDYLETMGAATVSTATQVAKFTGWSYAEAEYAGAGVTVSAQNPSSAYVGASGGNNLTFNSSGAYFTISGLNASLASSAPVLQFGCANPEQGYKPGELTVSVSDGGGTFTPLIIGDDARPANKRWAQITLSDGIPHAKNLIVRFESRAAGYQIDDIALTTAD